MSIHFTQGKLQGQERTEVLQEVQQQVKMAALAAIKPVLTAFLLAEQQAKLGREKGEARRVSSQPREIDWACGHCGCRDAHQFTRDGHYRRTLATGWGLLEGLQVPMLECQRCGHDVVCSFAILDKYERFWYDLDQQVLYDSGVPPWRVRWGCVPSMSASIRSNRWCSKPAVKRSPMSQPWSSWMAFGSP